MAWFQGLFLLVGGVILMGGACQGLSRGCLPFGSNDFRGRLDLQKDTQPLGFWAAFCLYALGALGITLYGLLILGGVCPPLPLRGGPPS